MPSATPILWMPIFAVTSEDRRRLPEALAEIGREDGAVLARRDPQSEELLFSGTSREHLNQTFRRIFDEMQIASWTGKPRVRYLETIRRTVEAEGRYIRQTGGNGNYGHVKLRLEPNETGKGIEFASEIQGGVVPDQYLAPIEEGIREAARSGILAGHEMTDIRVTLYDGSFHEVDSNAMAFQIAGSIAFGEAARRANPLVLEPMMSTIFTVAESRLNAQVAEISALGGRIDQTSIVRSMAIIGATVPLRTMLDYDGPAAHLMPFSGYEPTRWPPDSDGGSVNVGQPQSPGPRRTDASSADPGVDWT